MLRAIPFAGSTANTVRCSSMVQGQLVIGRLNLPAVSRIAAYFVVHGKVIRNGNLFRTVVFAVAAASTGNGCLGCNDGCGLLDCRPLCIIQRRNILQIVQHLLHGVHATENNIHPGQGLNKTQCPGSHAAVRTKAPKQCFRFFRQTGKSPPL